MYHHIMLPIVTILVTLSTCESVDQQYPSQTLSVSLLVDKHKQRKVKQNEKKIFKKASTA